MNMHLDCMEEGSSNIMFSRDESVKTRDESIEVGENTTIMLQMLLIHIISMNTQQIDNISHHRPVKQLLR